MTLFFVPPPGIFGVRLGPGGVEVRMNNLCFAGESVACPNIPQRARSVARVLHRLRGERLGEEHCVPSPPQ